MAMGHGQIKGTNTWVSYFILIFKISIYLTTEKSYWTRLMFNYLISKWLGDADSIELAKKTPGLWFEKCTSSNIQEKNTYILLTLQAKVSSLWFWFTDILKQAMAGQIP